MTEQFEKWVDERTHIAPSEEDHGSRACVNYWLTAFVKEVERRMRDEVEAYSGFHKSEALILAWNGVVRDFGLDGNK